MRNINIKVVHTAHHEAAHAVISHYLQEPINKISVIPDLSRNSDGHVEQCGYWTNNNKTHHEVIRDQIRILYAGREADIILMRKSQNYIGGAKFDLKKIDKLADEWGPECVETRKVWLRYLRLSTRDFVIHFWPVIEKLTEKLCRAKTLSGEQVEEIILDAIATSGCPSFNLG